MNIYADIVYSHSGYDVISYFQSAFIKVRKTAKIAPSDADGFGLNFSGAALYLPHQLVGIFEIVSIHYFQSFSTQVAGV